MSNYVKASHFLDDQLPLELRRLIPKTLTQAYKAAEDLAKDQPILEVPSARSNRGRLRSWATDLAFQRLIDTGQWPFDYDWHFFEKPTGKYLRIRLESSLMSVSLVSDPNYPPRKARYRTNNALGNPSLFLFKEMEDQNEIVGLPGFLLVHGHKRTPDFAHIGMPDPAKRVWLHRTPNLMSMIHEADLEDNLPAIEAQDEEAILTLKDELRKWQYDNEGA